MQSYDDSHSASAVVEIIGDLSLHHRVMPVLSVDGSVFMKRTGRQSLPWHLLEVTGDLQMRLLAEEILHIPRSRKNSLLVSITAGLDFGIETYAVILDELTKNFHEEMVLVVGVSYEPNILSSQVKITAFVTCYPKGYEQVNSPPHAHKIKEADIPKFLRVEQC